MKRVLTTIVATLLMLLVFTACDPLADGTNGTGGTNGTNNGGNGETPKYLQLRKKNDLIRLWIMTATAK